jgi:hypothetical protein
MLEASKGEAEASGVDILSLIVSEAEYLLLEASLTISVFFFPQTVLFSSTPLKNRVHPPQLANL